MVKMAGGVIDVPDGVVMFGIGQAKEGQTDVAT